MHADNGNCILRKSSPQYNLFTLSSFLHVYYLHGLTRKPNMIIDARADNAFYSIYRTHNAVRSLNKNSAAYTERCIGMHAMSRQTEDDGWSWCSTSLIVLRPQWTARNTACKHLHLPCIQRYALIWARCTKATARWLLLGVTRWGRLQCDATWRLFSSPHDVK